MQPILKHKDARKELQPFTAGSKANCRKDSNAARRPLTNGFPTDPGTHVLQRYQWILSWELYLPYQLMLQQRQSAVFCVMG